MGGRGRSERSRRERARSERPTILIMVEGETELNYFRYIKRRLRARWIVVEKPSRNDPVNLVLAARNGRRALERQGLTVHAWAVFDAEDAASEGARKYAEAIGQAEKFGVSVANSSPCFEYWALLHYAPGIRVESPAEAVRELGRRVSANAYSKPDLPCDELWGILESGTPVLAAEARRRQSRIAWRRTEIWQAGDLRRPARELGSRVRKAAVGPTEPGTPLDDEPPAALFSRHE